MAKAVISMARAVLLVAAGTAAALAQSNVPVASQLVGYIHDTAGSTVSGADVLIKSGSRLIAETTSDTSGRFSFQGNPGNYDLSVTARGFQRLFVARLSLPTEDPISLTLLVQNGGGVSVVSTVEPLRTVAPVSSLLLPAQPLSAKPSPAAKAEQATWEYGVLVQGGVGLEERTNFSFFMVGGHLGKVLTPQLGSGHLRGNVEYSVEVFPLWQSYTPKFQRISCGPVNPVTSLAQCSVPYTVGGTFTGASITPIQVRWNFTHGKRFMPWIQAAGGVVWTNHKYPAVGDLNPDDPTQTGPAADTSVWNFTPQGGIGAHYFLKPRRSMDFSINAVHISSASLGDKNPGVNVSLQMSVGYTWWK